MLAPAAMVPMPEKFVLELGASRRRGVLEPEVIIDTIGELIIIYVVTAGNILIPLCVSTFACLTLLTADSGWDTVVLVHARFLVFLFVFLSFLMLEPQERFSVHCWYTCDAAGKSDVEKGVM